MATNLSKFQKKHYYTIAVPEPRLELEKTPTFVVYKKIGLNLPSGNIATKYMKPSNVLSMESLGRLKKIGIIAPIEYNEKRQTMTPFKSRLDISAVNWSQGVNMSPIESYTFSICQGIQNIHIITNYG